MSAENQIRTLMRAWPRPDRTERGEEIVGTALDLVPEGTTRLPFLFAVNLVGGGLVARWRMRPPPWRWAYYRMGGRLPARWHRWVLNDLTSPGWRRRLMTAQIILGLMGVTLGVAVAQIATHQTVAPNDLMIGGLLIGTSVGSVLRVRANRNRQLVRHGCMPSNKVPWPPPVVEKRRV
jgi:hypothetical protein